MYTLEDLKWDKNMKPKKEDYKNSVVKYLVIRNMYLLDRHTLYNNKDEIKK